MKIGGRNIYILAKICKKGTRHILHGRVPFFEMA